MVVARKYDDDLRPGRTNVLVWSCEHLAVMVAGALGNPLFVPASRWSSLLCASSLRCSRHCPRPRAAGVVGAAERATRAIAGTGPGGGHFPQLTASGTLAPMPSMPGPSRPIDEFVVLLFERWLDSIACGVYALAKGAGDDDSRADARSDHATRDVFRPRASRRSPSSGAKPPSFCAPGPCVGERVRGW